MHVRHYFWTTGRNRRRSKADAQHATRHQAAIPHNRISYEYLHPVSRAPNFRQAISMGLREPQTLEDWAAFYPKFQKLPWLDDVTHQRIQRIREYIRIGFGAAPVGRRSRARQAVVRMLAPAARLRLRRNQYAVPMELWLLKSLSHIRSAVGLSIRTHVVRP